MLPSAILDSPHIPCLTAPISHAWHAVGEGSVIGPNVSVGKGVRIGKGVRLSNCVVMSGATLLDYCRINESIVGWDCHIGRWVSVSLGCFETPLWRPALRTPTLQLVRSADLSA